jgi:hypothetical protein
MTSLYDVPLNRTDDLVDVICEAFSSADPLADFVFEEEPAASGFKKRLFTSIAKACPPAALRQASSEGMEAVSVWFPPGVTYLDDDETQLFAPSEFESQETPVRIAGMLESIGTSIRKLGTDPQWYLHILATQPEYMGQGFTSPLLRPVLERATAEEKPCTLVCARHNVNLYEHFEFWVVDETKFSNSSSFLYSMRRDAES